MAVDTAALRLMITKRLLVDDLPSDVREMLMGANQALIEAAEKGPAPASQATPWPPTGGDLDGRIATILERMAAGLRGRS